jgi:hypothetical protein
MRTDATLRRKGLIAILRAYRVDIADVEKGCT